MVPICQNMCHEQLEKKNVSLQKKKKEKNQLDKGMASAHTLNEFAS